MARKNQRSNPTRGKSAVMGVNKSRTPLWMKVVLIVIAVAMAGGTALSFFSSPPADPAAATRRIVPGGPARSVEAAEKKYAAVIADQEAKVAADPNDRAALVELGNLYFDGALEATDVAQNFDELTVIQAWWLKAADAYERANAIEPDSPSAVDGAIALFYSGDTTSAIEAVTEVTERDPDFAMSWLNLGQFSESSGDYARAIAAYERFLEEDPTNSLGYRQSVQSRLKELR